MNMPILEKEFEKLEQAKHSDTTNVGIFISKTANEVMREAALQPDPKPLWRSLWYEGEVCCLFADTNIGKSIYAVQIANEIAKTKRVVYFDFELSNKYFQKRYTDEETREPFIFPNNLLRPPLNLDKIDMNNDFGSTIIAGIEQYAKDENAKILIVDNLSFLANGTEKGDVAGELMMKLIQLKRKNDFSILVVAHTPKRPLYNPITQNDLAGSKRLINFLDSAFAIGTSAKDSNLKYIKQIKCRAGEFEYGADNVIVCQIEKVNSLLQLTCIGYSTEKEHLKERTENDTTALVEKTKELSAQGKTQREISKELGISLGAVNKYLKN